MHRGGEQRRGRCSRSERSALTMLGRVLRGTRLDELPAALERAPRRHELRRPRPERPEFGALRAGDQGYRGNRGRYKVDWSTLRVTWLSGRRVPHVGTAPTSYERRSLPRSPGSPARSRARTSGRSGRGPTKLMSPRSTFQSCGSSSSRVPRRTRRASSRRPSFSTATPPRLLLGSAMHGAELENMGERRAVLPTPSAGR